MANAIYIMSGKMINFAYCLLLMSLSMDVRNSLWSKMVIESQKQNWAELINGLLAPGLTVSSPGFAMGDDGTLGF
ncbi:MAG: hypothetical protein ACTS73_02835 [Arsenophonus sp. NEOnobi-MAG3]